MSDAVRDAVLVAAGGFGVGVGAVSAVVACRLLAAWLRPPDRD